ncbi:hypothetical protein LCGC14_1105700 [marine sediment metagenome]|uniref:Uncharacterized protein n=1 Tax=marine sediment metagenome TaxID=412755 RepID=A0A0F9MW71_9ZZZZ
MTERNAVDIEQCYAIIRGLLCKGIALYGPFNSIQEAMAYGDKNFPDDTREIMPMYKEVVTHGE